MLFSRALFTLQLAYCPLAAAISKQPLSHYSAIANQLPVLALVKAILIMHSILVMVALLSRLSWKTRAQDLPSTIVGCAEVQCPTKPGVTSAQCILVDKTFTTIGLARIPDTSSFLDGLSWVEGVAVDDTSEGRQFDKSFYLGTPPNLDLDKIGGCSLFFTEVSDNVAFDDDDTSEAQGTCQQALSKSCVSDLIKRASDVNVEGLSSEDACAKLQKEFQSHLDGSCSSFTNGGNWSGVVSKRMYCKKLTLQHQY